MEDQNEKGPSIEGQNPQWPGDAIKQAGEVIKENDETTIIPLVR